MRFLDLCSSVCEDMNIQDTNSGSIVPVGLVGPVGPAAAWSSVIMSGLKMKDTIDKKLGIGGEGAGLDGWESAVERLC